MQLDLPLPFSAAHQLTKDAVYIYEAITRKSLRRNP